MKKLSFLSVLLAVLTVVCFTSVGCSDKKPAQVHDSTSVDSVIADTQAVDSTEKLIEETPMPKAADELFDDFVFNFAANRKLQMKRVHFPLPVYHNDKLVKSTACFNSLIFTPIVFFWSAGTVRKSAIRALIEPFLLKYLSRSCSTSSAF